MKTIYRILTALAVFAAVACSPEDVVDNGIQDVTNPMQGKSVYYKGETFDIKFKAEAAWTAELEFKQGEGWAQITRTKGNEAAGDGSVRLNFDANESGAERKVILWIRVNGKTDNLGFEIVQAGQPESSAMSEYLNSYMDEILEEDYLWAEQYRALERDLTVSYGDFLYTHLSKLGETNIEDGGYYRAYSANSGKRYIYSYIQEVTETKTKAGTLTDSFGLGIGPLFASPTGVDDNIYLTVGYVYRGSPAETAGLRKGDNIYAVAKGNGNPVTITRANYQDYMKELFSSPSGTYTLMFARYDAPTEEEPGVYPLNPDYDVTITAQPFGYDPILFAAYLKKSDITTSESTDKWPDFCIGYLAMESFDLNAQFVLEDQLKQFADAGINELVLDFSFCVGGVVDQACYLASSIVGQANNDKIFFTALFNDGSKEDWTFGGNNPELPAAERLPAAPDFGLKRVWIIVSENTASASELIINAFRSQAVNFPVTLIGSRTEGKNVGMEVSYINYGTRRFEFAPITYWGLNADGTKGPADGFIPEGINLMNNQNSSYDDDVINIFPYTFGDWDNFDFNRPFYYIFCDIVGEERPQDKFDSEPVKSSASPAMPSAEPIASTGVRKVPGRFGTIIYRNN